MRESLCAIRAIPLRAGGVERLPQGVIQKNFLDGESAHSQASASAAHACNWAFLRSARVHRSVDDYHEKPCFIGISDGYICSSKWMKEAYKRRPQDFKRRIIAIVNTTRTMLYEEEGRWLAMIPDNELGKRYYNLNKEVHGIVLTLEMKEKIRRAQRRTWSNPAYKESMRAKFRAVPGSRRSRLHTKETKTKMRAVTTPRGGCQGPNGRHSEETKQKMREARLSYWKERHAQK